MKHLSRWASRHIRLAIFLIIVGEVFNAVNGLLLGMNTLENWPGWALWLLASTVVAGAIFVRTRPAEVVASRSYAVGRRWLFGAFLSNFLLFGVLGGFWAESVQTPTPNRAVWSSRRVVTQSDTLIKSAKLRSSNQQEYYASRNERSDNRSGIRIAFILLFVVSLAIGYYLAILACVLICGNYAAAAALVLAVGIGILYGGVFFLSRAFERVIKPWREMDRRDRRRVSFRALLLLLAVWALTVGLSQL